MENNLHEDQHFKNELNDLFEGYEVNPSDQVWDNVNNTIRSPYPFFTTNIKWILSIALIVITTVGVLYMISSKDKNNLNPAADSKNFAISNEQSKFLPSAQINQTYSEAAGAEALESVVSTISGLEKEATEIKEGSSSNLEEVNNKPGFAPQSISDRKIVHLELTDKFESNYPEKKSTSIVVNQSSDVQKVLQDEEPKEKVAKSDDIQVYDEKPIQSKLQPVDSKIVSEIAIKESFNLVPVQYVESSKPKSRHSFSLQIGRSVIKPSYQRHAGGVDVAPIVFQESNASYGRESRINTGYHYEISPNWYLSSGFGVSRINLFGKHLAKLKLKDRKSFDSDKGQYSFQYGLASSTGDMIVEVRLDKNDPGQQFNDSEVVRIRILSKQQIRTFSVPLMLHREIDFHKFHFLIGTGFEYNISKVKQVRIVSNQLDRNEFSSHRNFREIRKINNRNVQYFTACASLKLKYDLTNKVDLFSEVQWAKSLSDIAKSPRIDGSVTSMGLNFGLSLSL